MSGSFWKFSNFTSLSKVSTLLETYAQKTPSDEAQFRLLLALLDEQELVQELLSNNPPLLEFLRDEQVLSMIVNLVINEGNHTVGNVRGDIKNPNPDGDDDEANEDKEDKNQADESEADQMDTKSPDAAKGDNESESGPSDHEDEEDDEEDETTEERATRRAAISAEILSADVWSLTDTVMESTLSLDKLWSLLDAPEPLSINASTYFMKIMEHLLDMKCDEMINYLIDHQQSLVEKFVRHLSNPPLMDFLLKLISTDKPDNSTGIIDFLQHQQLIRHLVDALDIGEDEDKHDALVRQSSAADFLKALITISANSTTDNSTIGPNELTRELVSHEMMERLCKIMLKGGYALANGVGIIIEIIRKNNSDYDILPILYITLESHPPTGRDPIYLGHLLQVFASNIAAFNRILIDDAAGATKLRTPFGEIEPLGFERFKICELVAELLHCSNMSLLNEVKGYDAVATRNRLREKMKEFDPVSFKYNEVIVLPEGETEAATGKVDDEEGVSESAKHKETSDSGAPSTSKDSKPGVGEDDGANTPPLVNDTIDSFNNDDDTNNTIDGGNDSVADESNASTTNLTEEQIRANPVVGDSLKIALFDTQIISNILQMFFRFPWNNFLHNVVFDIVQQVLNGSMDIGFNKFLAIDLFHLGNITHNIIEGQRLCTDYEQSHNGLRLGFMGHLTLIAEEVVKFIQLYPANTLSELIDAKVDDPQWEEYVNNVLYDTREKYNAILGGDEDEEEDVDHTFEEGLGEIIEEVKTELVFDKYEEADPEPTEESDVVYFEDDEHFRNYMSQLSTTGSLAGTEPAFPDGDDDYEDPNDDGMSYKRESSLYDSSGTLKSSPTPPPDEDVSSEDSTSSSDDDDDIDDENTLTRSASKS
ncbi:SIT4-associating protein Sap185p [Diutina catenulata]